MDLKDWAFKHRTYLKLEADKPVHCKFLSAKAFVDEDNEDTDKVRYKFEVSGSEKTLESQSIVLAEEMAKIKVGEWCKITRKGEGRNTKYEVEVLPEP